MAHQQQQEFCTKISNEFPKYFTGKKVLDIGSLDINGNNRFFLTDCNYIGLDVGEGSNVDVVQVAHLYDAPDEQFDLIISTEVFEHDMFYQKSIQNIIRMLKPGGAFIFTCASTGRPEHGTRNSDGSWAAPLLANISEEWSDYYMNLTESDIRQIKGFEEAFPDGIFEYNSNPGDLYFFGVKGGIANDLKFSPDHRPPRIQPGEFSDDIFVVDTWPNTPEKEADLVECIRKLREFSGVPILLVSHYAIKPEIQKLVDYYLFDKENPLLLNKDFNSVGVASGRWTAANDYRVDNFMAYHHDYAIWTSMTHAFNFCKYLGKKTIHFMEYDCLLDTFQYRQTFMEPSLHHDAVIYEYYKGSAKDLHLADSPFMATYLFSIKTDIAVEMMKKITSVQDYYANRPEGWQLERLFLKYLTEQTSNIRVSQYIANSNELNTQAVWNRDGILRNDAKFQVYPCADVNGNFYVHLISGFHEEPAESDYLLELKYAGLTKFITLKIGEMNLIHLGKYSKGQTIKVNYLGVEAYSEFLQDDLAEFLKMNIVTLPNGAEPTVEFFYNFVDGAYVEIKSESPMPYNVSFIDEVSGITHFSTTLTSNHWAKTGIQFFKNWRIEIRDQFSRLIESVKYDATGQRVYIALESKALGDTFAWLPYAEEFRKKHNCAIVCSTFHNQLFKETYPNIEFIEPGSPVNGVYAFYRIGWFNNGGSFDPDRNPRDFKTGPLQRTASDILGLEYQEIKPVIDYPARKLTKKVGLGIHSTAQAKYWNNPTGWQEVTDWLIENGYEPVILSREEDGYMGNPNPVGAIQLVPGPLENVIHELSECQAFIGISSGLTWLAWVTNTPIVQISGFTEPFNEPNEGITKVSAPAGACSGCANRLRFDPGDWNWCPDQKGTDRQFECSKLISADQVIAKLKEILV
jgi:autotransporter strand-loop-strand O-heptosyltransferase